MRLNLLKTLNENFGIKVFAIFTLFFFIISSCFTSFFIHHQSKCLKDTLIKNGKLLTRILAHSCKIGVFSENEELLKVPVEGVFQKEGVLEVSVFNLKGELLAKQERPKIRVPGKSVKRGKMSMNRVFDKIKEPMSLFYLEGNSKVEFWSPVVSRSGYSMEGSLFFREGSFQRKDRIIGFVGITVDKGMLNKRLNDLLFKSIMIAIIFLVIGSGVTYLVVRGITKPLNRLTEGVKTLGMGEVVEKVPIETKDEVGRLARAFNDMSESLNRRERALRESEERYRSVFENTGTATVIIEEDMTISMVNTEWEKLSGYSKKEVEGKVKWTEFVHKEDLERVKEYHRKRRGKEGEASNEYEFRFLDRHGNVKDILGKTTVIPRTKRRVASWLDITERRQAEEKIKESIREKEVLLREIHHRVKNNMQVISSLLNLQSTHIKDKEALETFKESQSRIRAMSLIHEKLYGSEDLARIEFGDYVRDLTRHIFVAYRATSPRVSLHIDISDIFLDINTAIPCGLIINELVSNSLKHAFSEVGKGHITITLHSPNANETELIVSDDGIGIPEDIDIRTTESLGLQVVTILAEDQLQGKITLDRAKGTTFHITWRAP
jgi:PAS domain S-box-containing protein